MLCVNETYDERKGEILRQIKVCRELMRACDDAMKRLESSDSKAMAAEMRNNQVPVMNGFLADLMQLERWQLKQNAK